MSFLSILHADSRCCRLNVNAGTQFQLTVLPDDILRYGPEISKDLKKFFFMTTVIIIMNATNTLS